MLRRCCPPTPTHPGTHAARAAFEPSLSALRPVRRGKHCYHHHPRCTPGLNVLRRAEPECVGHLQWQVRLQVAGEARRGMDGQLVLRPVSMMHDAGAARGGCHGRGLFDRDRPKNTREHAHARACVSKVTAGKKTPPCSLPLVLQSKASSLHARRSSAGRRALRARVSAACQRMRAAQLRSSLRACTASPPRVCVSRSLARPWRCHWHSLARRPNGAKGRPTLYIPHRPQSRRKSDRQAPRGHAQSPKYIAATSCLSTDEEFELLASAALPAAETAPATAAGATGSSGEARAPSGADAIALASSTGSSSPCALLAPLPQAPLCIVSGQGGLWVARTASCCNNSSCAAA